MIGGKLSRLLKRELRCGGALAAIVDDQRIAEADPQIGVIRTLARAFAEDGDSAAGMAGVDEHVCQI